MSEKEAQRKPNEKKSNKKTRTSLSSQKGADYAQKIREKKREDLFKEKRLERVEEIEDKKIADLNKKVAENLAKMQGFGEVNNSNVDEYYRQRNEGILQEELDEVVKIKANHLIPLWKQTIEELKKLEECFFKKMQEFAAANSRPWSVAQTNQIRYQIGMGPSIPTFIDGVETSLPNLEGDDSKNRNLAVASSRSRQRCLDSYLNMLID